MNVYIATPEPEITEKELMSLLREGKVYVSEATARQFNTFSYIHRVTINIEELVSTPKTKPTGYKLSNYGG